jgi:hypothetical protein
MAPWSRKAPTGKGRQPNTIDLQWEMRRELQCKALRRREKRRRRRNNGEQWKKRCAQQWKQSKIRARAETAHMKKPADGERRAALAQIQD